MTGSADDVLGHLQEAGRLDLGDYLRFETQTDPRNPEIEAEGMAYQGFRYRATGQLAGKIYGSPFGIDVAFADPMHGTPEEIEGSRFLQFAGIAPERFRVYPLETHIAEKLHAYTLPRRRPNSRVKDLPDIALLATTRDIDGNALRLAIDQTFLHRATHPVPELFPDPPSTWSPVYERIAETDRLPWRTLAAVTEAVRSFLDPTLTGEPTRWSSKDWKWL